MIINNDGKIITKRGTTMMLKNDIALLRLSIVKALSNNFPAIKPQVIYLTLQIV